MALADLTIDPSTLPPNLRRLAPLPDAGGAPVLPSGPAMNAPLPRLADAATPSISVVPTTRELTRNAIGADRSELNRLQSTGSGIDQLFRPTDGSQPSAGRRTLGVLGRIGDIAAGVLAPGVERLIPGTEGNHNRLIAQEQQRLGKDLGADQQQAQTELLNAQPALKQAALDNKSLQIENQGQHNDDMAQHYRDQAENTLRGQGYKHDPTGKIIPLDYEELSSQQQGVIDAKKAQADYKSAQAEYEKSKDDPNSFVGQQALAKMQHAKALEGIAYQKIGLEHQNQEFRAQQAAAKTPLGPDGLPGPKMTVADQNRASLARIASRNLDQVDDIVTRRPDILGKLGSVKTVANLIGSNDPDLVALGNEVHNFAMANAGIHGSRSFQNVQAAEQELLGHFKNGAAGIKGGINANRVNLNEIMNGGSPKTSTAPPPPLGTKAFTDGGVTYHIPQSAIAEFKKDHPNAK